MSSAIEYRNSPDVYIDPYLPKPDLLVLQSLLDDIKDERARTSTIHSMKVDDESPTVSNTINRPSSTTGSDSGYESLATSSADLLEPEDVMEHDASGLRERHAGSAPLPDSSASNTRNGQVEDKLDALNDPSNPAFEPSVFSTWDLRDLNLSLPRPINRYLLQPYIRWASTVVRNPTDVIMLTHLLLYAFTSIPSAVYLFYRPSIIHGLLHWALQGYYTGTYTLMRHQHIHMNGVLAPAYSWIDSLFPYILDPMFGHTWNSYYYHHVKHHHVEGNGPDDLSSTIRYQRDSIFDFVCYVGRFYTLAWIELPTYFLRKKKYETALRTCISEFGTYTFYVLLGKFASLKATLFVYLLPLAVMRVALMVGNWGQHAFVDENEPDSDFRSSITLIDVPSNRFCFNDGYHTSHHLNPRRHWREHPNAFLKQKRRYAEEHALVFRNIDYIMLTVTILRKDYAYLAKCLVPMGPQIGMSQNEIADMLRTKTKRFTEEEIVRKFR